MIQEIEISKNFSVTKTYYCKMKPELETVNIENLDYRTFFENYMAYNLPCIIKNISKSWKCSNNWANGNSINYNYFCQEYGEISAPVADCEKINFNAQQKIEMSVAEYMAYLERKEKNNILYLKDWHLKRLQPSNDFYDVPFLFASDWLNEFAIDNNEDDFMFVYIGPEKSWTPLHSDVYHSFSWSVNVLGKKKWIFFPPKEEIKLKDSLGNLPLLFDSKKFRDIKHYEIIQEKGDAVFVPSGWHHQVMNMTDTISINHNWINACNLDIVTESLLENLAKVEKEIADLKHVDDFVSQCQLILKADYGMNLPDYINFISYIASKRLKQFNGEDFLCFGKYILGSNHITFDLQIILRNLQNIVQFPLIENNTLNSHIKYNIGELIKTISQSLECV